MASQAMSYYTYENWRARGHRATIFIGTCAFCDNGKGQSTGTRSDNGKWHGPFDKLSDAETGVKDLTPHACLRCCAD
jgi:hypothetical protein